jgi:hypothetical protein
MFNPFKKKPFGLDDFAKLVITEAKKAGIAESLEYDSERFVLKRGDQRTYLANLFNDYCQAGDAHKKRILGNTLEPLGFAITSETMVDLGAFNGRGYARYEPKSAGPTKYSFGFRVSIFGFRDSNFA